MSADMVEYIADLHHIDIDASDLRRVKVKKIILFRCKRAFWPSVIFVSLTLYTLLPHVCSKCYLITECSLPTITEMVIRYRQW